MSRHHETSTVYSSIKGVDFPHPERVSKLGINFYDTALNYIVSTYCYQSYTRTSATATNIFKPEISLNA